ncbi:kinectin-like isoform X2 [Watersipora subatra]|uniref:kinectin-like isoform X2 n=1 Tax=Watersipora subatra TaxID=2589382 RepID=UPI00355ADD15
MDMFTLMMGVAATFVIGVVMMAITKFGFGGESEYEEQIARQKEVLLVDDKGKSTDKKKAKNEKKKSKIVKLKSDNLGQTSGSEMEAENKSVVDGIVEEIRPHIEYDPDPIVIEPDTPPAVVTKKGKKTGPSKSILHNRDEIPLMKSADAPVPETVFTTSPKDDLELKHSKPKKTGQRKEKQKAIVVPAEEPKPVVDEIIVSAATSAQSAAPQPIVEEMIVAKMDAPVQRPALPAKKPKARSKTVHELEDIIRLVGEAALSKDQMQALINSVMERMESDDSWTTKSAKPDPVTALRKQLEEVQNAYAEEISNVASAQAKIKDVTNKWTAAEKQSAASASQVQELQKRLQHMHDQHQKDIQALNAAGYQDKQKVEQQNEMISQLSEENQRLKQSVANTEEVTQMQNQLRSLAADKQTLTKLASDADKAVEDSKHEIERSKENQRSVEAANAELKKRCDELGQRVAQAENAVAEEQSKAAQSEQNARNLQEHIHSQLKDKEHELQALRDELNKTKELQQHLSTNGNHEGPSNGVNDDFEQRISSLEQTITDKDSQLSKLNKQLSVARASQGDLATFKQKSIDEAQRCSDLEFQVADMQAKMHALKDKNNELKRQIWTLSDSLNKAESLSQSIADSERDVEDKTCIINELKDSNSKLLSQNNELQEKCESMTPLHSQVSSLMKQLQESRQALDEKKSLISQLERSLKEEEQKVSATESECRDILERDFSLRVKGMAEEHEAHIKQLQGDLTNRQDKLSQLESLCNEHQAVVESLRGSSSASEQEVERLGSQLTLVLKDKQELQEKCESMTPLHSQVSSLMKQLQESRQALDEKESLISQLERSLKEKEQKVSNSPSEQEVKRLGSQLTLVLKDKQVLEARIEELESVLASKSVTEPSSKCSEDQPANNLLLYKNALRQVDSMLDSLTANVQKEHGKLSLALKSKDEQLSSVKGKLDEAVKNLDKSLSRQGSADKRVSELTEKLTESKQKLAELEKLCERSGMGSNAELSRLENALKDEQLKSRQLAQHLAAAMANSGGGDDSGTCV